MSREGLVRSCLVIGGACTSGIGIYHFFLPWQFRWAEYIHGEPEPIWAVFAMNAMLSFLMTWGGLTTIYMAVKRDAFGTTARFATLGMALFWIFNAGYQALRPPPFPAILRAGFLALAIFCALTYLAALFASGTAKAQGGN